MLRFLAGRVLQSLLILLGVTMITFGLLFLVPADPVRMIAGRSATPETIESIRRQLGLDQPIPVQYLRYLGNLIQGDLGRSYAQKAEVTELVASRVPATLQLMAAAIFFELLLGLPAGIYSATRRNRSSDKVVMVLSFICVSAPQFVVGLLLPICSPTSSACSRSAGTARWRTSCCRGSRLGSPSPAGTRA